MNKSNSSSSLISLYNGNMLLKMSIESFSKPGLKYDKHCQGHIHFSNRRHTKKIKIRITRREKMLTL